MAEALFTITTRPHIRQQHQAAAAGARGSHVLHTCLGWYGMVCRESPGRHAQKGNPE